MSVNNDQQQSIVDGPTRRLNRLDCCAVSDAMDKLGLKDRVASGLEQRSTTRASRDLPGAAR